MCERERREGRRKKEERGVRARDRVEEEAGVVFAESRKKKKRLGLKKRSRGRSTEKKKMKKRMSKCDV